MRPAHRTFVRCVRASSDGETGVQSTIFSAARSFFITFRSRRCAGIFRPNCRSSPTRFASAAAAIARPGAIKGRKNIGLSRGMAEPDLGKVHATC
jgi:hypothetical protein